jgi:TetR/AcrR family transcriptional regulator, transcriptional repressor of bet genes
MSLAQGARDPRASTKFQARRAALAESAIRALAETGYANTSLRDIAQSSHFSHGVLHYYFTDKLDLITCCVRQFKDHGVHRYDDVLANSRDPEEFRTRVGELLGESLVEGAPLHRLWYDLRTQSLYEPALRADALAIDQTLEELAGRVLDRYAELAGRTPVATAEVAYAGFDGLFQRALLRYLNGEKSVVRRLERSAGDLIAGLAAPGAGRRATPDGSPSTGGSVRPLAIPGKS